MNVQTAEWINTLGRFCGARDVEPLTRASLRKRFGFERADVLALFGGSIIAGADVLAQAMRENVAARYVIVGGEGHTTEALRRVVHARCPEIETAGLPEAEVFSRYMKAVYNLAPDHIETRSTNCGNNITNLLALLAREGIGAHRVILCQDATMQRRMVAGLRKYAPDSAIVNYATYRATVEARGGQLVYREPIDGMWTIERYVNLLMGEIPRLRDDENGYGPRGRGYIAHTDVPDAVERAFSGLQDVFGAETRAANPVYASEAVKGV